MSQVSEVIETLRAMGSPERAAGLARFGIPQARALGVSMPDLRRFGRTLGTDTTLARELWASGIHEARILASILHDPRELTPAQMDAWAADFAAWDVCDQCCMNLFHRTPHAWAKIFEWAQRDEEFVKRAAFALIATLAVHDKNAADDAFRRFLPTIERGASDGRNFVKKAISWALRQTGKRNAALLTDAAALAERLAASDEPATRWVGRDVLREFAKR